MFATVIAAIALQAATPTAEGEMLGREIARNGTLATLLPLMAAKETEDLIAAHPELSDADKARLRGVAANVATANGDRLISIEGHAFAAILSVADLRVLAAAAKSGAARRQRAALPRVIAATMTAAGPVDFKGETLAAFCRQTGMACPAK